MLYAETFNGFMKLMRPFMKQQGFSSRNNNFYKRHPEGNIGIINFQKNPAGFPMFSINIGIYSITLAKFFLSDFGETKVKLNPSIAHSHWQTCLGSVIPMQHPLRQNDEDWKILGDKWWWYDDKTNVEQLFKEVSQLLLKYGIPTVENFITDEQLKEDWLASLERSNIDAETETAEMQAATECGSMQLRRDLLILLLSSDDKEKFKLILNEFNNYAQRNPSSTGLRRYCDRITKEANLHTCQKSKIVDEILIPDNKTKKMKY